MLNALTVFILELDRSMIIQYYKPIFKVINHKDHGNVSHTPEFVVPKLSILSNSRLFGVFNFSKNSEKGKLIDTFTLPASPSDRLDKVLYFVSVILLSQYFDKRRPDNRSLSIRGSFVKCFLIVNTETNDHRLI